MGGLLSSMAFAIALLSSPHVRYTVLMQFSSQSSVPFPLGYRPITTFDTSVHNRLTKGHTDETVLAVIRERRRIRIAGLSVEELVSTPDMASRESLISYAKLLVQDCESDCLLPHNVLIKALIEAHYNNPWSFDWRTVDVRSWELHDELLMPDVIRDVELCAEQRLQQADLQKQFRLQFVGLRPKLDQVFEWQNRPRPLTFRESLQGAEASNKKASISMGKRFYDGITGSNTSRETIREFMEICPPFRAIIIAHMMAWYDLAIRDLHHGERFQSGRNDLCMAAYLPYCDEFVTAEKGREQERCLREISEVADIPMKVLSYEDFMRSLGLENKIAA